ncbi:MAG TPA: insulinase family protein, partial [Tichowtungia sp.]|nr:insulinase family protein [Tichowtungia sp.]
AVALKQLQEAPEDLSLLPTLEIRDIPPDIRIVTPSETYEIPAAQCYDEPTSGIFYFSSAIGCGNLPPRLLPWISFFCTAFTKVGTAQRDYVEMAKAIDAHTGGIAMSSVVRTRFNESGDSLPYVSINGKCLDRNQPHLFELLEEFMCRFDFSDLKRLKTLLLEYRAGLEASIVRNGHSYAMSLAMRNFSAACALDETWHGIHQLQFIKSMTASLSDETLERIADDLQQIAQTLLTAPNLKMAWIGDRKMLVDARAPAISIANGLRNAPHDAFFAPPLEVGPEVLSEGWSTSSAVSFVAQAFRTARMQHPDAPCLAVISKILRSMYLHREIREKGGAYGGFALYNPESGMFCFGSYRDPHIIRTLDVYQGALEFITSGGYSEEDVKEAILQVCSQIDKPDTPGPAARKAFYRQMVGLTDEQRQHFKADLLRLSRRQVMDVAHRYFKPQHNAHSIAVISGESQLTAANQNPGGHSLEIRTI